MKGKYLSVTDKGRHRCQARLNTLMPRQQILLVVIQKLVQNPVEYEIVNILLAKETISTVTKSTIQYLNQD